MFVAFRIIGKAAHAGGSFTAGLSAIEELARKVQAIHALTDLDRDITLNVGLVSGGQSVNTIAPWAADRIDCRYVDPADKDDILARIAAIVGHSFVPGTHAELSVKGEFLPLTQSPAARRLFELSVDAAAAKGIHAGGEFTGGCANSGFTAAAGVPTPVRASARWAGMPYARGVPAPRQPGAAHPGLRPGDPAAGGSGAVVRSQGRTGLPTNAGFQPSQPRGTPA